LCIVAFSIVERVAGADGDLADAKEGLLAGGNHPVKLCLSVYSAKPVHR
jgi:hypothetical protein